MQNYELLYIVPNQYTDEEAQKIKARVEATLKSYGAVIGLAEDLGKKKLAYPIRQVAHGYYFLNEFELEEGSKLAAINNNLRLDKEILRAQIVTKKKLTPEQVEEAKKREAARIKILKQAAQKETIATSSSTAARSEERKVNIKNLDEKLEEILKADDLV